MPPAIKRFFSLLLVFIAFFLLVTALRTWRNGGDLGALIPSFLRKSNTDRPETFTPSTKAALNLSDVEMISRLNEEYARLTQAVIPSVVSIDTKQYRTEPTLNNLGFTQLRKYPVEGQGSGVIVSEEGHVITNHHVIAGQQNIRITMHDGKSYGATLIGEDDLLDIAVLRIDSNETFRPLKLGDSSKVKVGQLVFAVGNPFGLGETVTQGIISAKERSLSDSQRDLFQTDAAINPGNSGGPLVNLMGEIIGINAAIYSVDRNKPSFQGVGFSIPSNDVAEALGQIIRRGRPIWGYLGVEMRDLDFASRNRLGHPQQGGSVVLGITPDSPAEAAGLMPDDIVETYNGEEIDDTSELISLVQYSEIGKTVEIGVWRDGRSIILKAKIREATRAPVFKEVPVEGETRDNAEILRSVGVEVANLTATDSLRGLRGVIVTGIVSGGLAEGILERGDLIYALNNSPITNATQFYLHLAASAAVQATSLRLYRDGKPMLLNLPPPEK